METTLDSILDGETIDGVMAILQKEGATDGLTKSQIAIIKAAIDGFANIAYNRAIHEAKDMVPSDYAIAIADLCY